MLVHLGPFWVKSHLTLLYWLHLTSWPNKNQMHSDKSSFKYRYHIINGLILSNRYLLIFLVEKCIPVHGIQIHVYHWVISCKIFVICNRENQKDITSFCYQISQRFLGNCLHMPLWLTVWFCSVQICTILRLGMEQSSCTWTNIL